MMGMDRTVGGNTTVAEYKYDPFGRRIEKNINGTVTKYLYDDEDIVAEYDGAENVIARYVHGPGVDEPLAMRKNGQDYFYNADVLGSITSITDSTQAVVQAYKYDAYGSPSIQNPSFTQPYLFTSREWDGETGLYYYRARYYDPTLGTFITKDPIGFAGGDVNLSRYVRNNPINKIDPLGLLPDSTVGGDDPGFQNPEETIRQLENELKNPNLSQKEKEQIRRRIKELRRKKSKKQQHHCESENEPIVVPNVDVNQAAGAATILLILTILVLSPFGI